ncbi:hypothetical protein HRW12_01295 [Streptomyces lunaelactis]|uniref:hypothetical protein n=1 Tax=Streptomyces lunaelactis TaxID=1535768 RepID=UPI0015851135|nr:hypothetical protein [Streptomyces lunaelactis]NUK32433.1 hypothetical protein [Streptomyces lunaelactis]
MGADETGPGVDARGARGLQVGDGNVQINVSALGRPAAQSAYLYQVQAIAPEVLTGRETELAELKDFCTRPDAGDYQWWRARAWAGKSALMSWFVLHPPRETRIVSFFITARLAAQSDRAAFLDVVIEQLATLLGEPVPPYLTAATHASHLWAMLDSAAAACKEQGQRLVLVVDGLDEDSGAAAHSIAALLPARPAAGMRIVVSGRHDPPVPSDVPPKHPLRDPAVVRDVEASPHAQDVRHDAERELVRLLHGTTTEQDLLGLVTAAGGGLSGQDLAELTGRQVWEIAESLHAVAGRTFARRPASAWSTPAARYEVYVLGHEELQRAAVDFLGDARLEEYRKRLHTWADEYRQKEWPAGTPQYLLRGYFRLLQAEGDLTRMIACALDRARHGRMLDVSGADAAALAEITTTQDAILESGVPDLWAMTLLSVHRDNLTRRNTSIPPGLPAVWAMLGHPLRAESLARSIPDRRDQLRALGAVTAALAEGGDRSRAGALADEVVSLANSASHQDPGMYNGLVDLVSTVARAGYGTHARKLAQIVTDLERQEQRTWTSEFVPRAAKLAWAAAEGDDRTHSAGDSGQGEGYFSRSYVYIDEQTRTVVDEAAAAAGAGDIDYAKDLVGGITDPEKQSRALAEAVWAAAGAGHVDRAQVLARSIVVPDQRAWSLAHVARSWAAAGKVARAEALAREIEAVARNTPDPEKVAWKLADIVEALAEAGYVDRAGAIAREIEDLALSIANPTRLVLRNVARALAAVGDVDRADGLARRLTDSVDQALTLTHVAQAAARAGDIERAEDIVWSIDDDWQEWALRHLARALAAVGEVDLAVDLAWSITDPVDQAWALADVARARAGAGDTDRAKAVAREAEAVAWSITSDLEQQAWGLAEVVEAWAAAGGIDRAEEIAWSISLTHYRAQALVNLASQVGAARAGPLIAQAVRLDAWQIAVDALAVALPDVLTAVADDLLSGQPGALG